jgi:uncharacterized protein (DUF934 family)
MQFIDPQAPLPAGALVLANTEDVVQHAAALATCPVVLLAFPKWTDGRAYSQAVVLRGRLRFTGEIRATGEVVADMLPLLRRCGFDAVVLAPGQSRATAERALGFITGHYQADPGRALAAAPALATP